MPKIEIFDPRTGLRLTFDPGSEVELKVIGWDAAGPGSERTVERELAEANSVVAILKAGFAAALAYYAANLPRSRAGITHDRRTNLIGDDVFAREIGWIGDMELAASLLAPSDRVTRPAPDGKMKIGQITRAEAEARQDEPLAYELKLKAAP